MADGAALRLGEVLKTQGHSPASISILVHDPRTVSMPTRCSPGGTLSIGDLGRPHLRTSLGWSANRLASILYDSLHHQARAVAGRGVDRRAVAGKLPADATHVLGDELRTIPMITKPLAPRTLRRRHKRRPPSRPSAECRSPTNPAMNRLASAWLP
jgi:glyoxylase-like metal-dependent hydrolase (beta-lactamase superfamily II)